LDFELNSHEKESEDFSDEQGDDIYNKDGFEEYEGKNIAENNSSPQQLKQAINEIGEPPSAIKQPP